MVVMTMMDYPNVVNTAQKPHGIMSAMTGYLVDIYKEVAVIRGYDISMS